MTGGSFIGWIAGTVFITVLRYGYKWSQDRRPFDVRYLATAVMTTISGGVGDATGLLVDTGDWYQDAANGFGKAVTLKLIIDIFTPNPPEVTNQ